MRQKAAYHIRSHTRSFVPYYLVMEGPPILPARSLVRYTWLYRNVFTSNLILCDPLRELQIENNIVHVRGRSEISII